MQTNLIGLSGKRGAGKDEAAKLIQQLQPEKAWQVLRFSEGVKLVTSILTGVPLELMHTQDGKQLYLDAFGLTVGEAQQKIGDGLRTVFHSDVWVLRTIALLRPHQHFIVTDVRYPNEAAAIEEAGGIVVRLEGDPLRQRGDGTRDDNHRSEVALDGWKFEFTIHNDGSIAELAQKLQKLLLLDVPTHTPTIAA